MKKNKQLAFRGGSYSMILTGIVLAILIVVNICASVLPTSLTRFDISSTKLYSITSNTKVVVNNLKQDVTIYWIVQADQEDEVIDNLLKRYENQSDHISVVKKNPDIFPTFAEQYTDEDVQNNSLVVESGDRYRFISYDDIYLQTEDVYSYSYTTEFDGEGAITSAIDYVVTEDLPKAYRLTGHGESELPETFADQVEKANIEMNELSLLTVDAIPEDAAFLMIYAPQSDISEEEKTMLTDYVNGGGKLLVMAGPVENGTLTNLNKVLGTYGVTVNEGIVVEADRDHYAFQRQHILLPDMASSEITAPLMEDNYFPIMPVAGGLTINEDASGVTSLMDTSDASYSKIKGYALETYDKENGDIDGPFSVAVSIEAENDGQILWFSSSQFLDDMYNAYSSGANDDLAMNAVSELVGEREAIAIRSKSLNYNYLTISDSQGSMLKAVLIGILPLMYLGIGIYVYMRTRRMQNETK